MIDTLDVEVTAEDITAGTPGRALLCPIALAVKRVLGEETHVVVTRHYAHVGSAETRQTAAMPLVGEEFVRYFDSVMFVPSRFSSEERAEHLKPFKMTLKFGPAEEAE